MRMSVVVDRSLGNVWICAQFYSAVLDCMAPSLPSPASGGGKGGGLLAGDLLGRGHLAMTIDQGADMSRYQGLVALTRGRLPEAGHEYFLRSGHIPTTAPPSTTPPLPARSTAP